MDSDHIAVIASMVESLTPEQKAYYTPFFYNNYVKSLNNYKQRISSEDIKKIEMATRGQTKNFLWNLLRLDRQTASGAGVSTRVVPTTAAMTHGHVEEHNLKNNPALINKLKRTVEKELNTEIVETVLEAGMFLSPMGLHSASPDAYFRTRGNILVPIEIKCPFMYKDKNFYEVQASLNRKKNRYRVKGTAFSLNPVGDPVFVVETTDPHYRQMQRQMYVMNSPLGVYLVKFGDSSVANTVYREDAFCLSEHASESRIFNMIVSKNKAKSMYRLESKRFDTLINLQNFTEDEKRNLAAHGIYHQYGILTCAFCQNVADVDCVAEALCDLHDKCAESKHNEREINVMFPTFFSNQARVFTLPEHYSAYSKQGLFYDNVTKEYKTFCCGLKVQNVSHGKINHRDNCEFNKYYLH